MTRYPLERVGSLLLTKAAVSGPAGVKVIRLLIDTGSVYTVLPVEVLESIGCSPAVSPDHVRLVTGSGYIIAKLRGGDTFPAASVAVTVKMCGPSRSPV